MFKGWLQPDVIDRPITQVVGIAIGALSDLGPAMAHRVLPLFECRQYEKEDL